MMISRTDWKMSRLSKRLPRRTTFRLVSAAGASLSFEAGLSGAVGWPAFILVPLQFASYRFAGRRTPSAPLYNHFNLPFGRLISSVPQTTTAWWVVCLEPRRIR
jgi:hypothetical protein